MSVLKCVGSQLLKWATHSEHEYILKHMNIDILVRHKDTSKQRCKYYSEGYIYSNCNTHKWHETHLMQSGRSCLVPAHIIKKLIIPYFILKLWQCINSRILNKLFFSKMSFLRTFNVSIRVTPGLTDVEHEYVHKQHVVAVKKATKPFLYCMYYTDWC